MANENILEIGATIDLSTYLPKVDTMVASTKVGTQAMAAGFQQLATSTYASTAQMTTAFVAVPAAAQIIPPAVQQVEVATESSTRKMGGAWTGLAETVRGAGTAIVGTLTEVGAKMSETAERSRLGVGVMESAFSGLSTLLGAGIAVGFAAHFLDESARVVIELDHLKVATGASIQNLAGLRAVAQQTAVPFENIQGALIRMQRAQVAAVEGNQMMRNTFATVGVTLQQLETLHADQLFFALARGIHDAHNTQVAANASSLIFRDRMGTLLPLLREHGDTLEKDATILGKHSGITDQAAQAALRWHQMTAQLAQTFQSFMIPVLEVVVPVIKAVQTAFEAVATVIVAVIKDLVIQGKLFKDIFTLDWTSFKADAKESMSVVGQVFKDGYGEIKNIWAKPIEVAGPESSGDLSSLLDLNTRAGKDAMSKFREELDQMRDAQTGFHELSKAEEADFWKAKLDIARGTPALYRQVYHEYVTAERDARKQSLSEEVTEVEQRVQSEHTGSLERVTIVQEELAHLRSIHAEETSEYKRLQSTLITVQREAVATQERDFVSSLERQLSAAKSAADKMELLKHAQLQAELAGFGTGGESYKKIYDEQQRAAQQAVDEQRSIDAIDADSRRAHQQSILEIERAGLNTRESLGLISATQRINLERQVITEEIALERQALEEKLALYKNDPIEYERVQKQLLALTDKYNKLIAANDNELLKQKLSGWQKFDQQVTSGFSTAVGRWVETGKGFGAAMAQMWNQLIVQWEQALAKMLAQFVLHQLAKVVVTQASEAQQTAATAAGSAARADVGLIADLKSIGRAAAVGAAHAFKWVMQEVPFPANVVLAPAAAAAAFAGILAFRGLASAAGGMLVDHDQLVQTHAKEMILPAPISTGLQNLVNVGGLQPPAALNQNFSNVGGSTSSSSTTHNHYNSVSPKIAVTVNGTSDGMKDLYNEVVKVIKRALRNGQLGFENA